MAYYIPIVWKSGGTRPPCPPPNCSHACFACDKTVINQRRVEKSAFEHQSENNSVWILKWTTSLGIFCKISFTPAVAFFIRYTPLKRIHTFLLRHCYATLGATRAETSLKLTAYCIEWSSPYPRCRWALHSQ